MICCTLTFFILVARLTVTTSPIVARSTIEKAMSIIFNLHCRDVIFLGITVGKMSVSVVESPSPSLALTDYMTRPCLSSAHPFAPIYRHRSLSQDSPHLNPSWLSHLSSISRLIELEWDSSVLNDESQLRTILTHKKLLSQPTRKVTV
jgi:hypothetical protein